MCLFKKKKTNQIITGNKFDIGDFVSFSARGERRYGNISHINQDENGLITYVITIGGECPSSFAGVKEDTIILIHK